MPHLTQNPRVVTSRSSCPDAHCPTPDKKDRDALCQGRDSCRRVVSRAPCGGSEVALGTRTPPPHRTPPWTPCRVRQCRMHSNTVLVSSRVPCLYRCMCSIPLPSTVLCSPTPVMEDRHWQTGITLALEVYVSHSGYACVNGRAAREPRHAQDRLRASGLRSSASQRATDGFRAPRWFWSVRGRKVMNGSLHRRYERFTQRAIRVRLAFGPLCCALTFPRGSCLSFPIHVTDTCLPVRLRGRTLLGAGTHHHGTT